MPEGFKFTEYDIQRIKHSVWNTTLLELQKELDDLDPGQWLIEERSTEVRVSLWYTLGRWSTGRNTSPPFITYVTLYMWDWKKTRYMPVELITKNILGKTQDVINYLEGYLEGRQRGFKNYQRLQELEEENAEFKNMRG